MQELSPFIPSDTRIVMGDPRSDDLVHRRLRPDGPDRLWVQDVTRHRSGETGSTSPSSSTRVPTSGRLVDRGSHAAPARRRRDRHATWRRQPHLLVVECRKQHIPSAGSPLRGQQPRVRLAALTPSNNSSATYASSAPQHQSRSHRTRSSLAAPDTRTPHSRCSSSSGFATASDISRRSPTDNNRLGLPPAGRAVEHPPAPPPARSAPSTPDATGPDAHASRPRRGSLRAQGRHPPRSARDRRHRPCVPLPHQRTRRLTSNDPTGHPAQHRRL